jgi:hypothetical protein
MMRSSTCKLLLVLLLASVLVAYGQPGRERDSGYGKPSGLPEEVLKSRSFGSATPLLPGQRFIASINPGVAAAAARGNVKDEVSRGGGKVVLESDDLENPFVVFEGGPNARAADIAQTVAGSNGEQAQQPYLPRVCMATVLHVRLRTCALLIKTSNKQISKASARILSGVWVLNSFRIAAGVKNVEEDAVRYHVAARPLHAEQLASAVRKLQQEPTLQPYGLTSVEANLFTTTQRSTTSAVNSAVKFPICIIGEPDADRPIAVRTIQH